MTYFFNKLLNSNLYENEIMLMSKKMTDKVLFKIENNLCIRCKKNIRMNNSVFCEKCGVPPSAPTILFIEDIDELDGGYRKQNITKISPCLYYSKS